MNWFLIALRKFADFNGRARRKEFWFFYLFMALILIAANLIGNVLAGEEAGLILLAVAAVGLLLPYVAVAIRRLHDTNKSGWWMLLAFVPIASLALLVFFVLPGTVGENRFGPDPKGLAEASEPSIEDHLV